MRRANPGRSIFGNPYGSQTILLNAMIRLGGPGGAGKSTIGALLAQRLDVPFLDLDRHFASRFGDISEFIGQHGYDAYARENIEAYCSLFREEIRPDVVALSSGFMTYASDAHLEYRRVRRDLEECGYAFILLPSLDRELCVAEIVRRQIARPFGRSPEREEAVIRTRFEIYKALPMRKVETMRPAAAIVNEILDLFAEDSCRNVYAGELEVRPPGAPTGPDTEERGCGLNPWRPLTSCPRPQRPSPRPA